MVMGTSGSHFNCADSSSVALLFSLVLGRRNSKYSSHAQICKGKMSHRLSNHKIMVQTGYSGYK